MTKRQIIEEIRNINTTADELFLSDFTEVELGEYLSHLKNIRKTAATNFPTRTSGVYVSESDNSNRKRGTYVSHKNHMNVGHRQLALSI